MLSVGAGTVRALLMARRITNRGAAETTDPHSILLTVSRRRATKALRDCEKKKDFR